MTTIVVKDHMQNTRVAIRCNTPLTEVVDTLLANNTIGLPVVDEEMQVIGFVSEQDCIKKLLVSSYHSEGTPLVNEVMFNEPLTVAPDDSIIEMARQMIAHKPKIYPVVEEGKLIGLITRADVLRALREHGNSLKSWTSTGT